MKTYIVIYLLGEIVGSIGPVPYDMTECVMRARDIEASVHAQSDVKSFVNGKTVTGADFFFKCEELQDRPRLSNPVYPWRDE